MRMGKTQTQRSRLPWSLAYLTTQHIVLHCKYYTQQGKQMKYFTAAFVQQIHLLDKYSNVLQNAQFIH